MAAIVCQSLHVPFRHRLLKKEFIVHFGGIWNKSTEAICQGLAGFIWRFALVTAVGNYYK